MQWLTLNMFLTLPKLLVLKRHADTYMCVEAHSLSEKYLEKMRKYLLESAENNKLLKCLNFSLKIGFGGVPNAISKVRFTYN